MTKNWLKIVKKYLKVDIEISSFLVVHYTMNWSPDWCPEVSNSIIQIWGIFCKFAIKIKVTQWFLYSFRRTFERINFISNIFNVFSEKIPRKYWYQKFVLLDLFSIRFSPNIRRFWHSILQNYRGRNKPLYEAQDFKSNQCWQSWCQIKGNWCQSINFLSIELNFQRNSQKSNNFLKLWWVGWTVLPDSLEITFFGTKIIEKSGENHYF